MRILKSSQLQKVKMKGIVAHWSAGSHTVSAIDKKHYHFIVSGAGEVVKGDHDVAANVAPKAGKYAAHTRNCNTGFIGVSMACMAGAVEQPFTAGRYPMTKVQWDAFIKVCADLCQFYSIPVTPRTVLSHAEVQGTLGIKQAGKWDFTRLAFDPSVVGAKACGDKMRREIIELMAAPKAPPVVATKPTPIPNPKLPDSAIDAGATKDTDVVLVDGPKKDETQVVIVTTPKPDVKSPAAPAAPPSKTGWAALAAIIVGILTGVAKYFGG